jgi:hypothetical protein
LEKSVIQLKLEALEATGTLRRTKQGNEYRLAVYA